MYTQHCVPILAAMRQVGGISFTMRFDVSWYDIQMMRADCYTTGLTNETSKIITVVSSDCARNQHTDYVLVLVRIELATVPLLLESHRGALACLLSLLPSTKRKMNSS